MTTPSSAIQAWCKTVQSSHAVQMPAQLSGRWHLCWKNHSRGLGRAAWRQLWGLCWERSHIQTTRSQGVALVCGALSVVLRGKVIFAVVRMGIMCRQRSRLAGNIPCWMNTAQLQSSCSHLVTSRVDSTREAAISVLTTALFQVRILSIILSWKQKQFCSMNHLGPCQDLAEVSQSILYWYFTFHSSINPKSMR